ncbi:MAG TPA: RtcB family protein, partial [Herpetosiphonaceae bacterium]|nr:RtcB family protein [Herpetosiphonaceae bacterium]
MPVFKEIPASVTGHVPVKIWTDQVEQSAEQQLTALAGCPFIFHHVAAMPDVHYGLGATIGSVFATRDALLPTAVGVDIGCGLLAQPFNVRAVDLSQSFLRELHEQTKARIPTGFGQHEYPQEWEGFDDNTRYTAAVAPIVRQKGPVQLGSLGGGNHFLELCQDEAGIVWLMLHSGSRGAGNMIAQHHIAIAQELNARLGIPSARDLWVLPLAEQESQDYLR